MCIAAEKTQPPLKLLFICTHNRCRSILAEAIANHIGGGLLRAASAGSEPADAVHPLTLQSLVRHGIPVAGLHSKSWDALADFVPDLVITVCDHAARETCPLWLGKTLKVHWGLADPSARTSDANTTQQAFDATIALLSSRLAQLRAAIGQGLDPENLVLLVRTLATTTHTRCLIGTTGLTSAS